MSFFADAVFDRVTAPLLWIQETQKFCFILSAKQGADAHVANDRS
jgi:hypothetical protein